MNVASLELCQELHELSGWDDTYLRYAVFTPPRVVNADEFAKNIESTVVDTEPAYDLGYLLRKLPKSVDDDDNWFELSNWLDDKALEDTSWSAGYNSRALDLEKRLPEAHAATPEDAACKLAIELFKQGVLGKPLM